jgi:hypothetical protein
LLILWAKWFGDTKIQEIWLADSNLK